MKHNTTFLLLLACTASFLSCSTRVDLYSDYKDIPVIYGIIDINADTNFIKITKAFCGTNDDPIDATEAALVYDSSNYSEKLDVYILELQSTSGQSYQPTGRKFILDTITIHNKDHGSFYAPDQTLYYTTEHFNENNDNKKYKYRLVIIKPDGDTITALTSPVGGDFAIINTGISFQSDPTEAMSNMRFRAIDEAPIYEVGMRFNYWEQHPGQPMEHKYVSWSYGVRTLSGYEYVEFSDNVYMLHYSPNGLFNRLTTAIGNDTVWDTNHPNVIRYVDNFIVSMSAGGKELFEYLETTGVTENGIVPPVTSYTNVNGGYGLFSSRCKITKQTKLSYRTLRDLYKKPWGFVEE